MALISYSLEGDNEDLSPAVSILAERETPFLNKIMDQSKAAQNVVHYWINYRLTGMVDRLSANIADGTSNVSVQVKGSSVSGTSTKYVVNTIIEIDSEQFRVLSIDEVTNAPDVTLTCSRQYAGTTHVAHTSVVSGSTLRTVYIVSKPKPESYTPTENEVEVASRDSNVTQIFHRLIEISDTSSHVRQQASEGDVKAQTSKKMKEMLKEAEITSIYGRQYDPGDATLRTMAGFRSKIPTGNVTDMSSNALATTDLDTAIFSLLALGAKPDGILVGNAQKKSFNQLQSSRFDKAQSQDTKKLQNILDVYGSEAGDLPIIVSQNVRPTDVFIISSENLTFAPLQGMGFQMEPLARTGLVQRAQAFGEFTMEIRLPETHWHFKNVLAS